MRILYAFLLVLSTALSVVAEEQLPCRDPEDDPETCIPADIELPIFCEDGSVRELLLGLDDNTFDVRIDAVFDGAAPFNDPKLYFVDGPTTVGRPNEQRIATANCFARGDGTGETCRVLLDPSDDLPGISERFNTDQDVINFVYRSKGKDKCLGKLTNSYSKLVQNGLSERVLCNFVPFDNKRAGKFSLDGEGFFDPKGYGLLGDALFSMSLRGLPAKRKLAGCAEVGEGRFQQAFSFTALKGAKDSQAYGKLTGLEEAEISANPLVYSHELNNYLNSLVDGAGILTSRSLAQIGSQISAPASSVSRSSGTQARQTKNKKSRKKKRKKKSKRRNRSGNVSVSAATFDIGFAKRPKRKNSVFGWLAVDPLAEDGSRVLVADSCSGKRVESKAYGAFVCGGDRSQFLGDDRKCIDLSSSGVAKGKACLDPRDAFSFLLVRAEGLAAGSYELCIDGQSVSAAFSLSSAGESTFGEIQLADLESVVERVPGAILFEGDLDSVEQISLSQDGCKSALVSGSLLD